jgi:hypothetical protein
LLSTLRMMTRISHAGGAIRKEHLGITTHCSKAMVASLVVLRGKGSEGASKRQLDCCAEIQRLRERWTSTDSQPTRTFMPPPSTPDSSVVPYVGILGSLKAEGVGAGSGVCKMGRRWGAWRVSPELGVNRRLAR